MSEHQTYEFLALDTPLDRNAMDWLRSLSSRAEISPHRFFNVYNYGDFRGDPVELMRYHFDVHLYLANFAAANLMVRVPLAALDAKQIHAFSMELGLEVEHTKTHWIISWTLMDCDDFDPFWEGDSDTWLERLMPIRDELLQGDLRSLYIGWLQGVTLGHENIDDDSLEPLRLAGLGQLTPAQQALAELLQVNIDLLEAAAMGSPERHQASDESDEYELLASWLITLSTNQTRGYLGQLLLEDGQQAKQQLRSEFRAWQQQHSPVATPEAPPRRVGELRANIDQARAQREAREQRQREAAAAKQRKARERQLNSLFQDLENQWQWAEREASTASGKGYQQATQRLRDLADAYQLQGQGAAFEARFSQFLQTHQRRPKLLERLMKAGLNVG